MPPLLPAPFKLERHMARWEFRATHPLCLSDCEPLTLAETLAMADAECKTLWEHLSLGYTDSDGLPLLRREITKQYTHVTADDVLVLVPQEAIQMAARALLGPGDHVICVQPAYQSLYSIAQSLGCEVQFWEVAWDGAGRPRFQIEALQALLRPNTRAVFTNFPHNPTGAMLSPADWQALVQCCRERGAYLFSDEMYRGLEAEGVPRLPAAVDCYKRAVSLSGMSKVYGMPGIRLGWLATRCRETRAALQQLHDFFSICAPAPSELLALIGLRNGERLAAANRALIASNVALARDFFARHAEMFEFQAPEGGSIAFPRLRRPGADVGAWCEALVEQSGVFLLSSTCYDHEPSVAEGRFRLGLGRRSFAAGLQALDAHLMRAATDQ